MGLHHMIRTEGMMRMTVSTTYGPVRGWRKTRRGCVQLPVSIFFLCRLFSNVPSYSLEICVSRTRSWEPVSYLSPIQTDLPVSYHSLIIKMLWMQSQSLNYQSFHCQQTPNINSPWPISMFSQCLSLQYSPLHIQCSLHIPLSYGPETSICDVLEYQVPDFTYESARFHPSWEFCDDENG